MWSTVSCLRKQHDCRDRTRARNILIKTRSQTTNRWMFDQNVAGSSPVPAVMLFPKTRNCAPHWSRIKGLLVFPLPPEISRNTRASRSPNCAPFHQLAKLNDTYKFSFYPRAIRTWNSVPLSLIPDSLDEFKAIISSM